MILRMDNTGAIYLANNQTTGQRTKHIDIRVHYVRNLINDEILKTQFVKSEDNIADICTKNTTESTFIRLTDSLIQDLEVIYTQNFLCFEYSDDDDDDEYEF
jgi:hypothetical protein